jgi:hypothetical protein
MLKMDISETAQRASSGSKYTTFSRSFSRAPSSRIGSVVMNPRSENNTGRVVDLSNQAATLVDISLQGQTRNSAAK